MTQEDKGATRPAWQIYDILGDLIAGLIKDTKITPNQVTFAGIVIGLIAAYFLYMPSYMSAIIGVLLLQASIVTDYVDGALARKKQMSSVTGEWFDHNSALPGDFMIFFAVCAKLYGITQDVTVWVLGFTAISLRLMIRNIFQSIYATSFYKQMAAQTKKAAFIKHFLPTRYFYFFLLSLAAILDQLYAYLVFICLYSIAVYPLLFIFSFIKLKKFEFEKK